MPCSSHKGLFWEKTPRLFSCAQVLPMRRRCRQVMSGSRRGRVSESFAGADRSGVPGGRLLECCGHNGVWALLDDLWRAESSWHPVISLLGHLTLSEGSLSPSPPRRQFRHTRKRAAPCCSQSCPITTAATITATMMTGSSATSASASSGGEVISTNTCAANMRRHSASDATRTVSASAKTQHLLNSANHCVCNICPGCPEYSTWQDLEDHKARDHHWCRTCGVFCLSSSGLISHRVEEHNMCSTCGITFDSLSNLQFVSGHFPASSVSPDFRKLSHPDYPSSIARFTCPRTSNAMAAT